MDKIIACDELSLVVVESQNRDKGFSKTKLFELLLQDLTVNFIDPLELFSESYGERFALYHINDEGFRDYQDCVWYSYWSIYHRNSQDATISPKVIFIEVNNIIFECGICGLNIIIKLVPKKELWRDSYYPNAYKYITSNSGLDIIQAMMNTWKYNLILGDDIKLSYDQIDLEIRKKLYHQFEKITKFKNYYMYYPITEISLLELQKNTSYYIELIKNHWNMFIDLQSEEWYNKLIETRNNGIYQWP